MGCFLACFGSSKEEKRRNQRKHKVLLRQQKYGSPNSLQHPTLSPEKDTSAEHLNLNSELPNGIEEELSLIAEETVNSDTNTDLPDGVEEEELSLTNRKKVTFDTNVKTYEPVSAHESVEIVSDPEENAENQRDNSDKSSLLSNSHSENDSITSSVGSYPPNHRYQNCRDSDDDAEEFECEVSDLDDENDYIEQYSDCDDEDESEHLGQKVWSESVPTASMESKTEISSVLAATEEVDSPLIMDEKEGKHTSYNRYARNRNRYSVLNPVENISQWKAAKAKATAPLKPQKENFSTNKEESRLSFSFMSKPDKSANQDQEISVDASLSSWLSSSISTPVKKTSQFAIEREESYSQGGSNSVKSGIEDRPILGALTVEEIQQFSASNSPRKSPSRSPDERPIIGNVGRYWNTSEIKQVSASNSPRKSPNRSPDEMPIIGNVGRYWNCSAGSDEDTSSASSYKGIPNTTNKYREDKKVTWHSTPFETRLERALKSGDIEA